MKVLILGAGASRSAGYPLASDLMTTIVPRSLSDLLLRTAPSSGLEVATAIKPFQTLFHEKRFERTCSLRRRMRGSTEQEQRYFVLLILWRSTSNSSSKPTWHRQRIENICGTCLGDSLEEMSLLR
jgi:hypothetical protein